MLMVSQASDALWWGDEVRMPLNGNLYSDSHTHIVSAHQRVKDLLLRGGGGGGGGA
jgi:hypothetical protein